VLGHIMMMMVVAAGVMVINMMMITITGLKGREEEDWKVAGVPITAMLVFDDRSGRAEARGLGR
jgi:hypothetical protein